MNEFTVEPWVQFLLLYFIGGSTVGGLIRVIVRAIRPYYSKAIAYLALVAIIPLMLSPILLGVYFTYIHVDGWWNLPLWVAVIFLIIWLYTEAEQTAK